MTRKHATQAESEIAALADGSLTPERRAIVLERVRSSPDLQAALAEQERAVRLLDAVDVSAPAALRAHVEASVRRRRRGVSARRRLAVAAAAAMTIAAATVAIGLSGGGSSGLSVQQAAALTLSPATLPAPTESHANRRQLAVSVEGVPFPYWRERFGWRSSGARSDRLDGRSATTVFYSDAQGRRVGYTIVSGRSWAAHGGTVIWRAGVPYRLLSHDGAAVVAWPRSGHLCVVSGRDVGTGTLLRMAAWSGERASAA